MLTVALFQRHLSQSFLRPDTGVSNRKMRCLCRFGELSHVTRPSPRSEALALEARNDAPCRRIRPSIGYVLSPPEGAVRELPTGAVTFLFADIEGSTELAQRLGDRRFA